MNNINALKQYNSKAGELKRLNARLKVIDIRLENWDQLQASTVTDDIVVRDTENGDKIGKMVANRETLQEERLRIELESAELSNFIIEIDSRLDCLQDNHRFILDKTYKENKRFSIILKEYNGIFGITVDKTLRHIKTKAHKELLRME